MEIQLNGYTHSEYTFSVPSWRQSRIEELQKTGKNEEAVEAPFIPVQDCMDQRKEESLRYVTIMANSATASADELAWAKDWWDTNLAPVCSRQIEMAKREGQSVSTGWGNPLIPDNYHDTKDKRIRAIDGKYYAKSSLFVTEDGQFVPKNSPLVLGKYIATTSPKFVAYFNQFLLTGSKPPELDDYWYYSNEKNVLVKIKYSSIYVMLTSNGIHLFKDIYVNASSYTTEIRDLETLTLKVRDNYESRSSAVYEVYHQPPEGTTVVQWAQRIICDRSRTVVVSNLGDVRSHFVENLRRYVELPNQPGIYYQLRNEAPLTKAVKTHNNNGTLLGYSTDVLQYKPGFLIKNQKLAKDAVFMGFELELEAGQARTEVIKTIAESTYGDRCIMKSDSSIGEYGLEIVTVPATLEVHTEMLLNEFPADMWAKMKSSNRTGMHIHIGKAHFSPLTLGKLVAFINDESNRSFIEYIGGRTLNNYCSPWSLKRKHKASCFGERGVKTANAILKGETSTGPRGAVNLGKRATVELRFFKASSDPSRVLVNLQFADAVTRFVRIYSLQHMYPKFFVEYLLKNHTQYRELICHLGKSGKSFSFGITKEITDKLTSTRRK